MGELNGHYSVNWWYTHTHTHTHTYTHTTSYQGSYSNFNLFWFWLALSSWSIVLRSQVMLDKTSDFCSLFKTAQFEVIILNFFILNTKNHTNYGYIQKWKSRTHLKFCDCLRCDYSHLKMLYLLFFNQSNNVLKNTWEQAKVLETILIRLVKW